MSDQIETFPCPFVYANGRRCAGHVTRVESHGARLAWDRQADGSWKFESAPLDRRRPWRHSDRQEDGDGIASLTCVFLFCDLKGKHAGWQSQHPGRMQFVPRELPSDLLPLVDALRPAPLPVSPGHDRARAGQTVLHGRVSGGFGSVSHEIVRPI
jgi:hypothetical protein